MHKCEICVSHSGAGEVFCYMALCRLLYMYQRYGTPCSLIILRLFKRHPEEGSNKSSVTLVPTHQLTRRYIQQQWHPENK